MRCLHDVTFRKGRERSIGRVRPSSEADGKIAGVTNPVLPSRPRPRSTLNAVDRFVRAPIGLLWLAVLVIVAVPLLVYMTLLYWVVQGAASLPGRAGAPRAKRSGREERVA